MKCLNLHFAYDEVATQMYSTVLECINQSNKEQQKETQQLWEESSNQNQLQDQDQPVEKRCWSTSIKLNKLIWTQIKVNLPQPTLPTSNHLQQQGLDFIRVWIKHRLNINGKKGWGEEGVQPEEGWIPQALTFG